MSQGYDASDIQVLTGLEPVRKRPGMYTDTARPNHLALEVIAAVVSVSKTQIQKDLERLITIERELDGALTLTNSTTMIEVGDAVPE